MSEATPNLFIGTGHNAGIIGHLEKDIIVINSTFGRDRA